MNLERNEDSGPAAPTQCSQPHPATFDALEEQLALNRGTR